jgi:hypothetical protein
MLVSITKKTKQVIDRKWPCECCYARIMKAWSPADGTILGSDGNFRRWGLAQGSRSLGACLWRSSVNFSHSASCASWVHSLIHAFLVSVNSYFFFFLLVIPWFELRNSFLVGKFYHLSHTHNFFALVCFSHRISYFCPDSPWTVILLLLPFSSWNYSVP